MSNSRYILTDTSRRANLVYSKCSKVSQTKKHRSAYPGFRLCTYCSRSINQVVSARTIYMYVSPPPPTKYGQRRGRRLHPQPSGYLFSDRNKRKNSPPRTLACIYVRLLLPYMGGGCTIQGHDFRRVSRTRIQPQARFWYLLRCRFLQGGEPCFSRRVYRRTSVSSA